MYEEKTELENLYGISSIWTIIRTFESISPDLIDDVVVEIDIVEMSLKKMEGATDKKNEVAVGPIEILVRTDEDQTGPLGLTFQPEEPTDATLINHMVQLFHSKVPNP